MYRAAGLDDACKHARELGLPISARNLSATAAPSPARGAGAAHGLEQLGGEVKTEQLLGDVRDVELRLQKELAQGRGDLTLQIERSRKSLLLWLIPLMFAQVGAMAPLVKLL
jgi:hypothetical protein